MAGSTNHNGPHKCNLLLPTVAPSVAPMFSSSPGFRTHSLIKDSDDPLCYILNYIYLMECTRIALLLSKRVAESTKNTVRSRAASVREITFHNSGTQQEHFILYIYIYIYISVDTTI